MKYVIIIALCALLLITILAVVAIFRTSHALIRPLRKINTKMQEIMVEDSTNRRVSQQELQEDGDSSYEISRLYSVFKDLI